METLTQNISPTTHRIKVQEGKKVHFMEQEKISFIEACNYYALIHEAGKTRVIRQTLDEFEKLLPEENFIRIHRSIILNFNVFKSMETVRSATIIHTTLGKDFRVSRHRNKAVRMKIDQKFGGVS